MTEGTDYQFVEKENQYLDDHFNAGDESMRPTERIRNLRKELKKYRFSINTERAMLMTEADRQFTNDSQQLKGANVLAHILDHISIEILEGELIVGHAGASPKHGPVFPEFSIDWILDELAHNPFEKRAHDRYQVPEQVKQDLRELHAYWQGRTVSDRILEQLNEAQKSGTSSVGKGIYLATLYMYGGVGHVVPNCERIFELGWIGQKRRVEGKLAELSETDVDFSTRQAFYQSQLITIDAVTRFIRRYADLAEKKATGQADTTRKAELLQIAENCRTISTQPPRTFYEAIQLWYFVCHITLIESNGHSISYGRFDQYMFPYYRRDLDEGRLTKATARELVYLALIKVQELMKIRDWTTVISNAGRHVGGSCFTLGGQDLEGNDTTNDITHFFLDAIPRLYTLGAWNAFRVHPKTPASVWKKLTQTIKKGLGEPKLFNDEVVIDALQKRGRSFEESKNYAIVGCVEADIGGREYGWHDSAYFNMVKVLELAINNGQCFNCGPDCPRHGICNAVGNQLGIRTGSLAEFDSFEAVKTAFDRQMAHWVNLLIETTDIMDRAHQELKPLPYLSLVIDDCIEKGMDVSAGGARYNFTGPQGVGIGTVADSLSAIRQLVFEEQKISGAEFLQALRNDWEGFEPLYALVNSQKVHHYGNDDDVADDLARFAFDSYCSHVEGKPNPRNGEYVPGIYSVSSNVGLGMTTWASADGRKAGEPVSDCLGPVHTRMGSHDTQGPTAMANSVAKLDHRRAGNGTLLNWKFTPATLAGETGETNFINLIQTYFKKGGFHSQFNVVDRETLLAAQKNPGDYRGLVVRVAGYSATFVDLGKPLQDDIIGRTELSFE
ncbi:MAG: formate C-acetyltransferase/glycerol dehydratase family glycyl radical enzyme [bacterium]